MVSAAALPPTSNHDNLRWERHAELITERLERMNATAYCNGEVGVEQVCNYKGLLIAMTGVGCRRTPEEGTAFLDSVFPAYPNIWRISMWHKNQLKYQTGSKLNGVGWGVYEASLKHGAIVMTGTRTRSGGSARPLKEEKAGRR